MSKIVELRRRTVADIPAMLRQCAADIEAGLHGDVTSLTAAMLTSDGGVEVFGWGETHDVHSIGVMQIACSKLASNRCERRT